MGNATCFCYLKMFFVVNINSFFIMHTLIQNYFYIPPCHLITIWLWLAPIPPAPPPQELIYITYITYYIYIYIYIYIHILTQ